jgi:hypothetical protein
VPVHPVAKSPPPPGFVGFGLPSARQPSSFRSWIRVRPRYQIMDRCDEGALAPSAMSSRAAIRRGAQEVVDARHWTLERSQV